MVSLVSINPGFVSVNACKRKKLLYRRQKKMKVSESMNVHCPLLSMIVPDIMTMIFKDYLPPSYRFIGAVNKEFRCFALDAYNNKCHTEIMQISSMPCMNIYIEERSNEESEFKGYRTIDADEISRVIGGSGNKNLIQDFTSIELDVCAAEAAKCGHISFLEWLWGKTSEKHSHESANDDLQGLVLSAHYGAASSSRIEVLLWVQSKGKCWNEETCSICASCGQLETLKYLRNQNYPWDSDTALAAGCNGHLEVFKYAYYNACPIDGITVCLAAAARGHLSILRWIHENMFTLPEDICWYAIIHGQLAILKWFVKIGYPIDCWKVCHEAAREGHVNIIQWAKDSKFSWNDHTSTAPDPSFHFAML
mmetsp:Transcript_6880/g.14842  ORF Transcript_6880/g.14842 Transcript_6880/m.14842 type:complete len:365 (-) Transcript_6880:65-1159(-)